MSKEIKWSLVEVLASDLKANPKNPKKRDQNGFLRLQKSLAKFGHVFDGIANKDMSLIDGHSRLELAEPNSKLRVFVPSRQLSEKEYLEMNAIFDLAKAGEIDLQILEEQFTEEFFEEWGMKEDKHAAQEDNYVIPEEIKTDIVLGDLIEIGTHRLLCGDSTDVNSVAKLMKGEKADMVMTDPPYNVDYRGGTGLTIMNDDMDNDSFYTFLLMFYKAFSDVTKEGGAWYVGHADIEGANFRKAFKESGLLLKQCLIWVKNALVMGRQDYHWKHEPCLYGWKEGSAHYFTDDRTKTTVIEDKLDITKLKKDELVKLLSEVMSDKTKTTIIHHHKPLKNAEHPTMKPILLLAPLIENSSKIGWTVADPFCGSGSTMVAAHQLKRKCYGMEIDPKYCQVIIDRMRALDPEIKVLKNGQPI